MDPIIFFLLLIFLFSFILFVVAVAIVWKSFSPKEKYKRAIKHQARFDFQQARGAAHLKILRRGKVTIEIRLRELNREIEDCLQALQKLTKEESNQLQTALEHQIAVDHMKEIPGIGEKLRGSLLALVSKGRLNDLKYASSRIHGIGDSRQTAIDAWLRLWQQRTPQLLEQDFPQKVEIKKRIADKHLSIDSKLKPLLAERDRLIEILDKTKAEIEFLSKVKVSHFAQVMLHPGVIDNSVDHFIQGAFPEWEPVPDWFKEMASLEKK